MPLQRRSLSLTEAYRAGMLALRGRVQAAASAAWTRVELENLDQTYDAWRDAAVVAVSVAQRQGVRLSAGYLSAFAGSELGGRVRISVPDATRYVGVSRDGRSLAEAYDSPRVALLSEIKRGSPRPLEVGLQRALRFVSLDSDTAVRRSLTDLMAADERVLGWRRVITGTCAACAGLSEDALSPPGTPLLIHPGCQCVSEPAFSRRDPIARPDAQHIFEGMDKSRQDALYGAKQAELLRSGQIEPQDLATRSRLAEADDFITAASAEEALNNAAKRHQTQEVN